MLKYAAACVPSKIEENEHLDLFQNFGQYEKFALHTGVERRRVASEGQTASDLCLEAAEKLLKELGGKKKIMDLYKFEEKFFSLFEVTPRHEVHGSVHFKTLEEWDSMMALETIAMVDEEFDVELNGDDIRYAKTVTELFEIVQSRVNE